MCACAVLVTGRVHCVIVCVRGGGGGGGVGGVHADSDKTKLCFTTCVYTF